MKLNRLTIQNFLSIQGARLSLADKGLVSIEGINEDKTGSDSNGAGKSSIINAILWCLYGDYGKDEGADDVVNSKAGKDCVVQCLWVEEANKAHSCIEYRITRYRKHHKYKNAVKVEMNVGGETVEHADGTITSGFIDITKAGSQAVQEQIDQIMGANEMVFRASCFAQQENPVDIPNMTDKQLKELLETVLPLENLSDLHAKAFDNMIKQRALVESEEVKISELEWQINYSKAELKKSLDARFAFADEVGKKTNEIDEAIKLKRLDRLSAIINSDKGTLKIHIAELKARQKLLGPTDVGRISSEYKFANLKVESLKQKLVNPENKCGECGQEVEQTEVYLDKLREDLERATREAEKIKEGFRSANKNLEQYSSIEIQIREQEAKYIDCSRAADRAAALGAEISLLEGQKAALGVNPHQATVERLRAAVKANLADKQEREIKFKEAKSRLELLKAVQLTYSPKGLRYHILEKVAPRLTSDTNNYLQILTDGAISAVWSTVSKLTTGDYREKFSIEARMDGRSKFGLLSGGEKRKVRLACFYALQDLIASQATKKIDLWCGDEIDDALDAAGMERLMGLLNEKTKTKSTILVISHNELREWIPNHVTVTRKDGISTITGYLNV